MGRIFRWCHVCDLCGHVWLPGDSYPVKCSCCESHDWDKWSRGPKLEPSHLKDCRCKICRLSVGDKKNARAKAGTPK